MNNSVEVKKLSFNYGKVEILKNLESFKKDLFNLRFQKNNGQLKSPAKFKETRKKLQDLKQ